MADRHTGRAFDPYTYDCKYNNFQPNNRHTTLEKTRVCAQPRNSLTLNGLQKTVFYIAKGGLLACN